MGATNVYLIVVIVYDVTESNDDEYGTWATNVSTKQRNGYDVSPTTIYPIGC